MNEIPEEPTTRDSLHVKLHAVQAELRAPKDKTNEFAGFAYRSAEEILALAKPIIHRLGCRIQLTDRVRVDGQYPIVRSTAMITDGIETTTSSGEAIIEVPKKGMDASQCTGSASSYARKYALMGLLAIDDGSSEPDAQKPVDKNSEFIDSSMARTLDALLDTTGTEREKFFAHFKVKRLHDLTIAQFMKAQQMLLAKKAKIAAAAGVE